MIISGINISKGIALGKVFKMKTWCKPKKTIEIDSESVLREVRVSINQLISDLEQKQQSRIDTLGEKAAEIFNAHKMILEDVELYDQIKEQVIKNQYDAPYSIYHVTESLAEIFEQMDNDYFRERAQDFKDIGKQLIQIIRHEKIDEVQETQGDIIVVASDLTPSDTAKLDPKKVKGFITKLGGKTSHTAIIANMMGIPAISGVDTEEFMQNQKVLLNGNTGDIIKDPNEEVIRDFYEQVEKQKVFEEYLNEFRGKESLTKDGHRFIVQSNIVNTKQLDEVLESGDLGIGLFRTEFIFMERNTPPDEELQFKIYQKVARSVGDKTGTIRILDVGGDKNIDYLNIEKEDNPFLGYRAIRYLFDHQELLKTQLKAILRASAYGNLKILIPMISTVEEFRQCKGIIKECMDELTKDQVEFDKSIPIGIMIEVPSAAILSGVLAQECDFFSIGTNDLIQYLIAVDRMNTKVDYLYSDFNPAVLMVINSVVKSAQKAGIPVSICGNSGENTSLLPFYIGIGLSGVSVNPRNVVLIREKLSSIRYQDVREKVAEVSDKATVADVESWLATM